MRTPTPDPPADPSGDPSTPTEPGGETLTRAAAASPEPAGRSVLIFSGDSAALHALPDEGDLTIGRAAEVELRLTDPAASRRHARLALRPDAAILSDLGSHNGTTVNGERLAAPRALQDGDAVTICDSTLVFRGGPAAPRSRPLRDEASLRQRLEEEIERARRYDRTAALVCVALVEAESPAVLAAALSDTLRVLDVAALVPGGSLGASGGGPGGSLGAGAAVGAQLLVLLPELEGDEAAGAAERILAALRPVAPRARAGYALCPADGCDADALLGGARAAAALCAAGRALAADAATATIDVGGLRAVVVEPAMVRLFDLLRRLARSDLPVLLRGETGTGKEVAARALHAWSRRAAGRLVALNCAAVPEALAEGELFGYERGAFTGAAAAKAGLLEAASGGTLLLDEVGELSPAVQAKLLRALESGRTSRLGDLRERAVDLRIVAATHRDLAAEVAAGRFRQDLFFRLGAATVHLPPLRDRRRELPILARTLLADACARAGRPPMTLSAAAMARLLGHGWPGNVRELRNQMEYVAATAAGDVAEPWHLGALQGADEASPGPASGAPRFRPLGEELGDLERARMAEALAATGGHHRRAAELLAMPLRTFAAKFKRYRLGG